jgi:DNA processing protein
MDAEPRQLSAAERLDWLRLIRSENVGPITFFQLLQRFGSAAAAIEALPRLARRGGLGRTLAICPKSEAEREIETLAARSAKLLFWGEPDYPVALAAIDDAPPVVGVQGHLHLLARPVIAVVGARNASANGRAFARQISAALGQAQFVVASGLARGIDAAAHEGALPTGTVAVLGGGLDVVYPPENAALYERVAAEGLLMSESPFGAAPHARNFPRRNRIISGLSRGVLVVEAAPRSGSLITARLAAEQGREVLAVPGSPLDPRCRGTNDLIRNGAVLVESASDVIEAVQAVLAPRISERGAARTFAAAPSTPSDSEIEKSRARVTESLGPSPVLVDEIVRQCQMSSATVSTILLELELAGRLERHPGNRVSLTQARDT